MSDTIVGIWNRTPALFSWGIQSYWSVPGLGDISPSICGIPTCHSMLWAYLFRDAYTSR